MLGLNPLEQEILDLTNEIARNGFIYFPEFCHVVYRKYREEDEDLFRQNMFKVEGVNKISKLIILANTDPVWHQTIPRKYQGKEV